MKNQMTLDEVRGSDQEQMWLQDFFAPSPDQVVYRGEEDGYLKFQVLTCPERNCLSSFDGRQYEKLWRCFRGKPNPGDLMKPFQPAGFQEAK